MSFYLEASWRLIKTSIPYGNKWLEFEIPVQNFCEVLYPNKVNLPYSEIEEIKAAIDNPIGTNRIENLVDQGDKVAIICEDVTRPARIDKIILILLEYLNKAGVYDRDITVVMALGSHRPMSAEEIVSKVGEEVFSRVTVINSEHRDKKRLVDLGYAPGNVRVWADRNVVGSDIKIGVGSIAPHPDTGYTGGGKIIYPGIVGEETAAQFHLRGASLGKNVFGMEENQLRSEMERWVDTVGLDFIVNAIVTPENKIYKVVAGHYVKAHRKGVNFAKEIYGVKARGKVEIGLVSSYPMDLDLWQATKAIMAGELIVKDRGTLILVTPCSEGIGPHPSFINYIGAKDPDKLLNEAWKGSINPQEILPLAIGVTIARVRQRIKIALVSEGLKREEVEIAGFKYYDNIATALQEALENCREGKISIIPCGGQSFPILKRKKCI